jgi:S-formylglutathione hydrolase FrmB
MSLLGTPLIVLLACVAVLTPVATVVMWSRVRGPHAVRFASRAGMLVAGQLASVLLVAALANDYGEFYSSWADLAGNAGGTASVSTFGSGRTAAQAASPASLVPDEHGPLGTHVRAGKLGRLHVLGVTGWSSRAQWATRGLVESVMVDGLGSRLTAPAYVYLPPQYFQPAWAHRRFPAVEVLSGYPGSAESLVNRVNYPQRALAAVLQHRSAPMIYVMLSSTVAPPRDTECTDVPNGPQVETFLDRELPSAVQASLRVRAGDWGIMGDSTGGYCAAKILMTHYTVFRAGVSLSGYYGAREDVTTGNLWGGSKALRMQNDPELMLRLYPAPPVSLFVTISKQETGPNGYPGTRRFLSEVKPPMQVTAMILSHGGHNFRTWDRELPTALHWLSVRLTRQPTAPTRS